MTLPVSLDTTRAAALADRLWEQEILPALSEYIRIPNRSQAFDPDYQKHGHMDRAVALLEAWCEKQPLPGLSVEVHRLEGRAPVILMELGGSAGSTDTVLLYGHLDKQPEMLPWREGLSPWEPVREGDRLYGRGGADDGYSAFASLAALRILHEQGVPHARAVVLIEAGEESGSPDLPAYMEALASRIGTPSLVVCLDSGCANYDQLWSTTSLRGIVGGTLRVEVLTEGVHSGSAGGVVPSSFRILRQILARIEDTETGKLLVDALHVAIPEGRIAEARASAETLRGDVLEAYPWAEGTRPSATTAELAEMLLDRTWRPSLAVTGADGLPPIASAGNVLRPFTAVKLSIRIPPRLEPESARAALSRAIHAAVPPRTRVTFTSEHAASGWDAPPTAPWLEAAMQAASRAFFGKPAMSMGEGGTIPFMSMLGRRFPEAQFLITGVLGPQSNAHGPNEFLHIPTGKKITASVAAVLAAHAARS